MRQLQKMADAGKKGKHGRKGNKDAEIAELWAEVSRLQVRNQELVLENRKLRTRNNELGAAYAGLKAILRDRGASTP